MVVGILDADDAQRAVGVPMNTLHARTLRILHAEPAQPVQQAKFKQVHAIPMKTQFATIVLLAAFLAGVFVKYAVPPSVLPGNIMPVLYVEELTMAVEHAVAVHRIIILMMLYVVARIMDADCAACVALMRSR